MGSDSRNSDRACVGNRRNPDQACSVDEEVRQRAWAELIKLFAAQTDLERKVLTARNEP